MLTPSSLDLKRLKLLTDLGHDLLVIHDLKLLLDSALQRVISFTDHDSGSIMLYNDEHDTLEVCASRGLEAVPVGTRVENLQRSVAGKVLLSGKPIVLYGRGEDVGTTWRDYTRDIPSVVCLPLLTTRPSPIGVLSLMSTVEPRQLDDEDIDTLHLLAVQIAAAIENTRLHEERNRLLVELASSESQLRELIGRLLTAQEEERRRVAYDLHDGLAQMAASSYQHLQNVASRYHPRSPQIRYDLAQSLDLLQRTVKEARNLIGGLRPAALDDLGLRAALRLEIQRLCSDGWQIMFVEDPGLGRLPPVIETALFRSAQEALTNVRKHAGATRVVVSLQQSGNLVRLTVRDWGCGFETNTVSAEYGEHLGIIGMQERSHLLGGRCLVVSQIGSGTTVTLEIPWHQEPAPS